MRWVECRPVIRNMADPKLNYKHYPRSVSWQVASVLNPSLQNSLPASQQSKHTREKRERSESRGEAAQSPRNSTASKPWQEEESLPLPPQYVSPGALCNAMPKYMRVKARPDQQTTYAKATTMSVLTTTSASCSPANLPFSPHYDLAVGSPRSDHSSAKLTSRSVMDSPKQVVASPQQAKPSSNAASPASPARSPGQPPLAALVAAVGASSETTPPVRAPHQNTPQTQATGSRSSPSGSRRHSGAQSPRIRLAATSPMHPSAVRSRGVVMDAASLQSKLNTIAQSPELPRAVQMHSAAQGSPLSPANTSVTLRRENYSASTPPVALPPTPPVSGRQRRTRNPPPREPTLETYKKISPNTYATNTVWNDRRDQDSRDQTQPRRTILIKSN